MEMILFEFKQITLIYYRLVHFLTMWRSGLAKIYDAVLSHCRNIQVDASEKLQWSTTCLETPLARFDTPCEISVVNADSIDTAMELDMPVVLNLASPTRPGGGVRAGALAQEEELFRRTAYHKTLLIDFYPLGDDELVYSPSVPVVLDRNYKPITGNKTVSFLACAGLRWPPSLQGKYYKNESDKETTRRKIQLILRTAYTKGHTNLVLGALGCGCFRAPPEGTARLFKEELERYEFSFSKVVFAILGRVDTRLTDIFASVFSE